MRSSLGHIGHVVKSFLNQHWNKVSPLLIGYSGGPDSKALLYALIEWGQAPLHIAHVDHGWRPQSRDEALFLQKEAQGLGVPFHTIRLEKLTTENEARQCRLAFFRSLQKEFSFQATLLAHHADDQAETVLKRLFEGAHLPQLSGMSFVSSIDDVAIWRPLLSVSKNEIHEWLKSRNMNCLDDITNHDPTYLRARMRSELMPFLNRSFGKNISENLAILSERSRELQDYLAQRLEPIKKNLVHGPFGWWLDATDLHRLELRHLLIQVANLEEIVFSRPVLESILDALDTKKANHSILTQHRSIVVDRGHFFLLAKKMPRFEQPVLPKYGRQRSGDWAIEEIDHETAQSDWRSLWRGEALIQCFDKESTIEPPPSRIHWPGKVPHFLRRICPILRQGEQVVDFVSGRANIGRRSIKIFIDLVNI